MPKKSSKQKKKLGRNFVPPHILWLSPLWQFRLSILTLSILLYANTLGHDYTQDDAIVIYDNMFTTKGLSGIPGLLKHDTFYGFFKEEGKSNLVSGGRYRPLTPVMFAVGWQLFGNNPFVGHLWNALFYALIGLLIFELFRRFPPRKNIDWTVISFVTALLFIAHPVHTEVVANIKGRDEIMTLLGSLISLFAAIKAFQTKKIIWFCIAGLSLFCASMSKENAVTFIAIIPLTLWFFYKASISESIKATIAPLIGVLIFIGIRTAVLGFQFGDAPNELMNNPFLKVNNGSYIPFSGSEFIATIMYTLGKYVQLLFFPHPLTHDYYPRHIDVMTFGNITVWLSIIMYVIMAVFALSGLQKKSIISYGVIYFIATLSIVSNIVFPIGTNMSERFLFMPSIGFSLILSYLIITKIDSERIKYGIIAGIVLLFSIKTIHRNTAWKNDFTLFNTDKHISKNSAKINNAAAGSLSTKAYGEKDKILQKEMLEEAIMRCDKAISIHPNYKNAYLIKANAYHYLDNFKEAEKYYDIALSLDPGFTDAIRNSGVNYRSMGRQYGEVENNLPKAIEYLKKAIAILPEDYEVARLLGTALGFSQQHQESINYFTKALQLEPNLAGAHVNLGKAYMNAGNSEQGNIYLNKALELDPNALNQK